MIAFNDLRIKPIKNCNTLFIEEIHTNTRQNPSQVASTLRPQNVAIISQRVFHLPHKRNPFFIGREELLKTVREKIQNEGLNGYKHQIALHGLGGVGKTEIAVEYCFRHKDEYDYIFWISAVDRSSLLSGFVEVAKIVGCVQKSPSQTHEAIAKLMLQWLQSTGNWLLIFDNLDDHTVTEGYIPVTNKLAHILITTRITDCDILSAQDIEIQTMTSEESVCLLLTRANLQDDPTEEVKVEAAKIVAELGNLPLAIEQAASYIRKSRNIFEYLVAFRCHRLELLSAKPEGNRLYKESIATTWKMSLHRLERTNVNAKKLIELFAFLNPDGILLSFLKAGDTQLHPEFEFILDPYLLRQSLIAMEEYSLIHDHGETIVIHRLMQCAIRYGLDSEYRNNLVTRILQLALSVFPENLKGTNRQICRAYRSQVVAILENVEDNTNKIPLHWPQLYDRLTQYLLEDGYYSDCAKYSAKCFDLRKRILGLWHRDTLGSMFGLAKVYRKLGLFIDAVKLSEECFDSRKRMLGSDDPDTLHSMSELGVTYFSLGQLNEALKLDEQCLETRTRILGSEHPDTLRSMGNLANTYGDL